MGNAIGSGLLSMAICFDFRWTNIVQPSNRNPYIYQFWYHHPLITQLIWEQLFPWIRPERLILTFMALLLIWTLKIASDTLSLKCINSIIGLDKGQKIRALLIGGFYFDSLTLPFWFDLFLVARAEIFTKISLVFWSLWWHQKGISKLTDL